MSKSKKLKAFTLVEMLIVIVIIGVLAAAILPNLIGARNRANDVARVAALNKINAGIQAYIADTGRVPDGCGPLSDIATQLGDAWMYEIPTDPSETSSFDWINSSTISWGQYWYCSITANWSEDWAYVIMAKVERAANANYVIEDWANTNHILESTSINQIQTCNTFDENPDVTPEDLLDGWIGSWSEAVCHYTDDAWELRYIVIQS